MTSCINFIVTLEPPTPPHALSRDITSHGRELASSTSRRAVAEFSRRESSAVPLSPVVAVAVILFAHTNPSHLLHRADRASARKPDDLHVQTPAAARCAQTTDFVQIRVLEPNARGGGRRGLAKRHQPVSRLERALDEHAVLVFDPHRPSREIVRGVRSKGRHDDGDGPFRVRRVRRIRRERHVELNLERFPPRADEPAPTETHVRPGTVPPRLRDRGSLRAAQRAPERRRRERRRVRQI
mmetsp:Transcript_12209/g.43929  ORF Transcript_12209/g.43929 Transcript_12209/m.43929 type:complete len:240 (+) Transcript_12209:77-796(+)